RALGARWFAANLTLSANSLLDPEESQRLLTAEVRRKIDLGARQVLKAYCCADRFFYQMAAETARRFGVGIAAHTEGLANFLVRTADGYAVDHEAFAVPLYNDVIQYVARSGVIWTPTSLVGDGVRTGRIQNFRYMVDFVRPVAPEKFERFG